MMFNFSLPLVCCQLLCLEVGGGERARESKGAREQGCKSSDSIATKTAWRTPNATVDYHRGSSDVTLMRITITPWQELKVPFCALKRFRKKTNCCLLHFWLKPGWTLSWWLKKILRMLNIRLCLSTSNDVEERSILMPSALAACESGERWCSR